MDTTKTVTHISLCAGYGGIDLGLKRAIPNLRTVAFSEIEAFACANLVSKMEAGLLDAAPIWTNLKTFPWESFRGRVDILSGGYPCQPFSAAGKRLGKDDPRHLWPWIADGIAAMRPKLCFFENVEGHITMGLSDVIEDLAGLGYRTTWGIFSAAEVGAPHQRKRVFILAHRKGIRLPKLCDIRADRREVCPTQNSSQLADSNQPRLEGGLFGGEPTGQAAQPAAGCRSELADASNGRWWQDRVSTELRANVPQQPSGHSGFAEPREGREVTQAWPSRPSELANADPRRQPSCVHPGSSSEEIGRGQEHAVTPCGVWPSRPNQPQHGWEPPRVVGNASSQRCEEAERTRRSEQQASGISEECGAGIAEAIGSVGDTSVLNGTGQARGQWETQTGRTGTARDDRQAQPTLGRDADGPASRLDYAELCVTCDNRTDELRLLGNGVVPATAERAFRTLMAVDSALPNAD